VREAERGEAIARLADTPHIILNAPLVGQRLGYADVSGLDLLELFAFIHPARFAVPTVAGLARAVGVDPPDGDSEAAATLVAIADALLTRLAEPGWPEREGAWTSNATLYRLGWGWALFIGQRLAKPERGERMLFSRLQQWEEQAERPQAKTLSIPAADAEARLAELTGKGSEPREGQRAMPRRSSPRAAPWANRTCCWPRPEPGSARR
jgi:ATP-dependent DNA helicase DinG